MLKEWIPACNKLGIGLWVETPFVFFEKNAKPTGHDIGVGSREHDAFRTGVTEPVNEPGALRRRGPARVLRNLPDQIVVESLAAIKRDR